MKRNKLVKVISSILVGLSIGSVSVNAQELTYQEQLDIANEDCGDVILVDYGNVNISNYKNLKTFSDWALYCQAKMSEGETLNWFEVNSTIKAEHKQFRESHPNYKYMTTPGEYGKSFEFMRMTTDESPTWNRVCNFGSFEDCVVNRNAIKWE